MPKIKGSYSVQAAAGTHDTKTFASSLVHGLLGDTPLLPPSGGSQQGAESTTCSSGMLGRRQSRGETLCSSLYNNFLERTRGLQTSAIQHSTLTPTYCSQKHLVCQARETLWASGSMNIPQDGARTEVTAWMEGGRVASAFL